MNQKMNTYRRKLAFQSILIALGLFFIPLAWTLVTFGPWGLLFIGTSLILWGAPRGLSGGTLGYRLAPWEAPGLNQLVGVLTHRAGLTQTPEIWLQGAGALNAGATLRDGKPAILLTEALVQSLRGRELAGVLAHEISHLKHRDLDRFHWASWAQGVTLASGAVARVLSFLDPLVLGLLLGSFTLVNWLSALWSRIREFAADLGAAQLTGDPQGLSGALRRITWRPRSLWDLLMGYRIQSPRSQDPYRTHPDPEERIRRLEALGAPRLERQALVPWDWIRSVG